MKYLILAGGSGTRLWPLSRKNYPKQFLRLTGDKSLLQQTVDRALHVVSAKDIIIMTNNDYKFHVLSELNNLFNDKLDTNNTQNLIPDIILEPACRNTAPAIALGMKYCLEKMECGVDEVVFISPSDHVIKDIDQFKEYVKQAEKMAKEGFIVTFGINPTRPETGYGYIKTGEKLKVKSDKLIVYKTEEFTEKPDIETAKKYVDEGTYYWNSGMFAFTIETMLDEFSIHSPTIYKISEGSLDEINSVFHEMPNISIDYAVIEKSNKVVTLPMDIYWNDIGSWDSLFELLRSDEKGNIQRGDVVSIGARDSMVLGSKRLITLIGLEDSVVIETEDAILISKRGQAQRVKEIVELLEKLNRKEASEHVTTYRPWGSYTVLEEGHRYKIKRVVVNPRERLSLQMHYHRSEHWVVVKGTAKVTIGKEEKIIHENESAYVPKSTLHRLENPGRVPLEIIEVQNGEYVGEDDIVRIDDMYGREKDSDL